MSDTGEVDRPQPAAPTNDRSSRSWRTVGQLAVALLVAALGGWLMWGAADDGRSAGSTQAVFDLRGEPRWFAGATELDASPVAARFAAELRIQGFAFAPLDLLPGFALRAVSETRRNADCIVATLFFDAVGDERPGAQILLHRWSTALKLTDATADTDGSTLPRRTTVVDTRGRQFQVATLRGPWAESVPAYLSVVARESQASQLAGWSSALSAAFTRTRSPSAVTQCLPGNSHVARLATDGIAANFLQGMGIPAAGTGVLPVEDLPGECCRGSWPGRAPMRHADADAVCIRFSPFSFHLPPPR